MKMDSVGSGGGEVNSIDEKTMVENGVGLDSEEILMKTVEENHVGVKVENLMNSVGEGRVEVNDVDLMNSIGEKRLVENEMEEILVKRVGENHVGVSSMEGVEISVEGENRIEVNVVGSMVVESDNLMNSDGERRLEENNVIVESVKNSANFVNKRVGENGAEGNSVGLWEEGVVGEKGVVVDSVGSTQVESGNLMNLVDEKRLGENDVDMELMNSTNSDEEKRDVGLSKEGVQSLKTLVGEKRAAENGVGDDLGKNKKARINTGRDIKRVAEIVMVLSAMGNMRGGRSPTAAEIKIMAEAREKLIGLCEGMTPKDIVPRDAVRVVIEDLGLNKSRDQRLSFRPPMTSIKEKLELAKRKMEESKKFAQQSGIHSSQTTHAGLGSNNESHGAFVHATQRFPPDRPSHNAVVTGGSETTFSMVSRGSFSNPLERDASSLPLPRAEAVHFRLDGRSNVSAYPSQVRANPSGDHSLGKSSTFSPQHQLGAVPRVGVANKVPERTPVISASQVAPLDTRDRNSNHSVTQTAYGSQQAVQQPLHGLNFVQASPTYSNHSEIAKSVQKFLHPRLPERPSWTPPSTDYMNKSLTCQACKESVNDVESLLVCDACEKGNHIKCLQAYNQKGIPKGEWHCPHCLIASHGKPLPPKYGRVTRNNSAPKVSSNAAAVQVSAEKKVENSDKKVNHQTTTANGNPGSLHPAHVVRAGNIHVTAPAGLKMLNIREVQAANSSENKVKMDDNTLSTHKLLPKDMSGSVCALSSGKPNERTNQQFQSCQPSSCKPEVSIPDPKSLQKVEPSESCLLKPSEAGIGTFHSSQPPCSSQDVGKSLRPKIAEVSSDQYNKVPDSRDFSECKPGFDVRKDGQDAVQAVSVGNVGVGNGARDCLKSSLDGLHSVDWVGDILNVVDEKAFYTSCHINGMVYKLQDHALFSNNGNLRPSKLQALWEDTKTGSKWAIVNSCYFPADLPEVVGRPCSPENNEVYESNHGSTVRAGLVHGPCEVLPPNKFKEESERRIHSDDGSQPVFLCKWFYDESKGLFRPVTD